jgi:hypothetical protein
VISHPFEIKPSTPKGSPDELMIAWGDTPSDAVASIFLPAVAASDIISLADTMYVKHRLTTGDAHTVLCPAGNVTLVPIPKGEGRYAGLLSIDLPPTVGEGQVFTISVRQLTEKSATIAPPPPPPKIALAAPTDAGLAEPSTFSWREVLGAFQYTVKVTPGKQLLFPQERLLAWLKWRISVTPPSNRWLPVLERYLSLTAALVQTLGQDPNAIAPSQAGTVPGAHPAPPAPPSPSPRDRTHEYCGKIVAIDYDRFGDFSGFVILTEAGHEHRFHGREHPVEELVRKAWEERTVVCVVVDEHAPDWPTTLILRRYH